MFTVTWLNTPLDRLADAYVSGSPADRERMAVGIDALNSRLRSDPLDVGESRSEGFRIAFAPPLAVGFHVDEAGRDVTVMMVKLTGNDPGWVRVHIVTTG